jgi:hypothetical protein
MLGERKAEQFKYFAGNLRDLLPGEHIWRGSIVCLKHGRFFTS